MRNLNKAHCMTGKQTPNEMYYTSRNLQETKRQGTCQTHDIILNR